jgi:adenosylmethionine---8-amino-7-oxononanoate aminotransferase
MLRSLDNAHVWHPFTAMSAYRDERAPIIVEADGFFLVDTDGNRYLDGHSSLWCNIHGHRVVAIDEAIRRQLDRVAHSTLLGLANEPSIELAAELVRRTPPGLDKVFYSDCGAAGVEVALKIAYQYHRQKRSGPEQRDLFVCLGEAYHGDTVGTISLGGIDRFHSLFGSLMFPALRVPTPGRRSQAAGTRSQVSGGRSRKSEVRNQVAELDGITELERILVENADRVAGFVIEPLVQAAAGILVHPAGYLARVRELTRKYGILLIADEIAVGFGRTGTMFACEQEDVSPDIMILSKGLTGGYLPLAATLTTDEIYDAFLGDPWAGRTFYHGHTYTGNPLACAAALASLRLIDQNNVLGNARRIAEVVRRELAPLTDSVTEEPGDLCPPLKRDEPRTDAPQGISRQIAEVRQKGTMVGIELVRDRASGTPFPPERRIGHQVTLACRRRGVILRNVGDTIILMPAPAMPEELVVRICEVVVQSICEVVNSPI